MLKLGHNWVQEEILVLFVGLIVPVCPSDPL